MYRDDDFRRIFPVHESDYRSPVRRDYARLIHSPSFRRLQGKTQLYPGVESDFFRNRLTHSIEVAQIAKTIAMKLNFEFEQKGFNFKINEDICEFAGLAHDLGHPPFGHQGEEALDECMMNFGGFEGNAQSLRILSKIEKKREPESFDQPDSDSRIGLNLTFRTLASILKYDAKIPLNPSKRPEKFRNKPMKGFYESEDHLVKQIKKHVVGNSNTKKFKTVECWIMDVADDIAYSTYDLEDGMKAGFYHPTSFLTYPSRVYEHVAAKVSEAIGDSFSVEDVQYKLFEIFEYVYTGSSELIGEGKDEEGNLYHVLPKAAGIESILATFTGINNRLSLQYATNGELRGELTSKLVNNAINGVRIEINESSPSMSKVFLEPDIKVGVEVLKNFTFASQILSPRLKIAEYRGKEIVKVIFSALSDTDGHLLLPEDFQARYNSFTSDVDRKRCICDFIAGMTDKYAIEFYGRLKSERPETIFKPF
ncbi:deoxyguanosinetriphosphate triphosphohydrolase family protein [Sphingobacterium hotanense]|uniref:Deoxyguanosinetriphosphate triphosphohydrolase-like protein n=1 Tax=Sphingobacterium hotanense TaxID=649196 RepID=A0ABT7NQ30_9SPHI|nr:dNTP triphosphohydrolase [Sphingobacterium hotanense]MDM1049361.1 dNTP triphosphohydrolase [Sphingobacterium hotanense]